MRLLALALACAACSRGVETPDPAPAAASKNEAAPEPAVPVETTAAASPSRLCKPLAELRAALHDGEAMDALKGEVTELGWVSKRSLPGMVCLLLPGDPARGILCSPTDGTDAGLRLDLTAELAACLQRRPERVKIAEDEGIGLGDDVTVLENRQGQYLWLGARPASD